MLKETDGKPLSSGPSAIRDSPDWSPPSTGVLQVCPAGVGVPQWGLSYGTVPPKGWRAVLFICVIKLFLKSMTGSLGRKPLPFRQGWRDKLAG